MVRWQVYVGGKQRGGNYDNKKRAIEGGAAICKTFKQVYVYEVVDNRNPKQIAKWVDGERVA